MRLKDNLKSIPFFYKANSLIKARQQEHFAKKELAHYNQSEGNSLRMLVNNKDALAQVFKERLNKRGVFPRIMSKGEMNIFLTYPLNNWESVLPYALEPFGRITEFKMGSEGFDIKSKSWIAKRDRINKDMLDSFHRANAEDPVNVVVSYLSGFSCDPAALQVMSKAGAIIFNFWWDDKLGFRGEKIGGRWSGPAAIASSVDLNLTNAPDSVIKYFGEGGLSMFWPEAAHPLINKSFDIPFEYDVSVLGGCYGWRPLFVQKLQKLGINLACFGNGWPNGPLSDEESVKLFSRSRINLGFAGVGHSKQLMCLKGRDFEVPMSGGLYLTQNNPELSLVYDINKEIVTYKDEDDCFEKITWLLENPSIADEIRKKGRERAMKDHTWEKRFDEIFRFAGFLE